MSKKKTEQEKVAEAASRLQNELKQSPPMEFNPEIDEFPDDWNPNQWEEASVEIWRPEPGQAVMGFYESSEVFEGDYDEPCMVHRIIDHKTGERISFVGGKMCDLYIKEAGIQKDWKVFILYKGTNETRKGNRVNNFKIRYQRP